MQNQPVVLIIPIGLEPVAEAFGVSKGWGFDNYTIDLCETQGGPATHRATVAVFSDPSALMAEIERGKTGQFGQQIKALADALIIDWAGSSVPSDHFNSVLQSRGLFRK